MALQQVWYLLRISSRSGSRGKGPAHCPSWAQADRERRCVWYKEEEWHLHFQTSRWNGFSLPPPENGIKAIGMQDFSLPCIS